MSFLEITKPHLASRKDANPGVGILIFDGHLVHRIFLAFPDTGHEDQAASRQELLSRTALVLSRLAPGVHW